jgi:hypothetical protein
VGCNLDFSNCTEGVTANFLVACGLQLGFFQFTSVAIKIFSVTEVAIYLFLITLCLQIRFFLLCGANFVAVILL